MFNSDLIGLLGSAASIIVIIALYVLQIIAYWKIFNKFGEPGWKAIIPFYNFWIQLKYTWQTKWFWIIFGCYLVGGIFDGIAGEGNSSTIGSLFQLAGFVFLFLAMLNLSKSFGHGVGYAIGLVLIEFVFILILGFGSSQYLGNLSGKNAKANDPFKPDPESDYTYAIPVESKPVDDDDDDE